MPAPLLSFDEASALVAQCASRLSNHEPPRERVSLARAAGRVLADPLCADSDQPSFSRSTRDGFACRAAEASKHAFLAMAGSVRAGDAPSKPLAAGSACEIMTGAPVPDGADAVAMLEHVETNDGQVRLLPPRRLAPGENLVARGAQAHAGDELLPTGTLHHCRTDRSRRLLRSARPLKSSFARALPFSLPAMSLWPWMPRRVRARSATPMPPCWRRWSKRPGVSLGFAHCSRQCSCPRPCPRPSCQRRHAADLRRCLCREV